MKDSLLRYNWHKFQYSTFNGPISSNFFGVPREGTTFLNSPTNLCCCSLAAINRVCRICIVVAKGGVVRRELDEVYNSHEIGINISKPRFSVNSCCRFQHFTWSDILIMKYEQRIFPATESRKYVSNYRIRIRVGVKAVATAVFATTHRCIILWKMSRCWWLI